ncbi:MAG: FKBP-type peptidyl-prolyl cis-trans isomerase [Chryseosolibacter sp.]
MNKYNYAFIGLLTVLVACKNEKETPSGLKYTIIEAGDGVNPKTEEVLVFDYELRDSKDSVWGETFTEGIPAATKIADSTQLANEDGMTQMFRSLSIGDSVKTVLSVNDFFNDVVGAPVPPQIDTTLSVTYTLKVKDIMSVDEFMKAREALFKKREAKKFNEDTEEIGKYLSGQNLTASQDTSGLQFIIHNTGSGKKPSIDDCVEVKYKGRFLKTGEVFDQAEKIAFPLNGVIAGWKLGIPMLGKGDSATFYIPSKLAYGPQGYPGAIPPDAILIFNVTLLDVKSEFDQATRSCK